MDRVIVNSRVGADGVLEVHVPLGSSDANREVRVTIEQADRAADSSDDYLAWLQTVAGKWQGEFQRPSFAVLEEREPLS